MTESRRGRPRIAATDRRVLDAAEAILREGGPDALTMTEVARRSGVAKQTLYRRWPSKHALAAQCVLDGVLIVDAVIPVSTGDAAADLRAWWTRSHEAFGDHEQTSLYRMLTSAAAADAGAAERLAARLSDPIEAALREVLAGGIESGELRKDLDVDAAARLLVDALSGELSRAPSPRHPSATIDLILRGMSAH
ncbi:MAG: TetR/AcrR family transcriptional regulator [Microbacterium sp.]